MANPNPDPEKIRLLIELNFDARRYFYSQADEKWLDWLRDNGFLEVVKERAADPTKLAYQTPELDYLTNMAERIPEKVVDFILTVPVSQENFNPEVVDRFLWSISKMPAAQIKRVVPKIRDEQWLRLMASLNRWIYEYKKMFEALAEASDAESILALSEAVLVVRSKEELAETSRGFTTDNPFYVADLHDAEVFSHLASVDDAHLEAAFQIAANALGNVSRIGDREDDVFEIGEIFHLFDVDFFSLELGHGRHYSQRDDVRELAAVVKVMVDRSIGNHCGDPQARAMYEKFIAPLPDSRSMWRLRLYVWSRCPEVFKSELKTAFFRGLESRETLWPITGGAEYDHALKSSFGVLPEADRKAYIARAFELLATDEEHPYGHGIFASIQDFLSADEKKRVEALYKVALDPKYTPEPSVGHSYGGTVVPQAPENSDDVWTRPVPEIVEILKTKWTPDELRKLDTKKDFLRPINAEGVADKMRSQIKERTREYTKNATLFFDRNGLDSHYTYSFFRGIDELLRLNGEKSAEIDWEQIIALGLAIVAEGEREPFDFSKRERDHFDAWLAGWTGIHDGLADVVQHYLRMENQAPVEHFPKHRDDVFTIIRYLLTVPDPTPEDEQPETAASRTSAAGGEMLVSDPLSIAINSARGRGYEAFVLFMECDGRKFSKDEKIKLSEDVLGVYKDLLAREDTGAIRFLYGNYLPFFYFRAVGPIRELFPEIFTKDPKEVHLYLAAWEGYLARSLYREMFDELEDEYERAIKNDPSAYPKRNYRADLDDALATHIALAYVHFKDFTLDSKLFKLFWGTPNKKRHQEFVSFMGGYVISRSRPKEYLAENPEINLAKLMAFWDWAIENVNDPDAFAEFGFWMNTTDGLYEDVIALAKRIRKTLEKSNGRVDWEIKFIDSLPTLVAKAPDETVEILRLYFTPLDVSPRSRHFMRVDDDLVQVFRTLYQNPKTRDAIDKLIDELLPLSNGAYWRLKEARN